MIFKFHGNFFQEPILKRKKEQLTTKHSDAVQLLATVNALKDELASKSGKIQPDSLYNLLEVFTSLMICTVRISFIKVYIV